MEINHITAIICAVGVLVGIMLKQYAFAAMSASATMGWLAK